MSEPSPPETRHLNHRTVVLNMDAAFRLVCSDLTNPYIIINVPCNYYFIIFGGLFIGLSISCNGESRLDLENDWLWIG